MDGINISNYSHNNNIYTNPRNTEIKKQEKQDIKNQHLLSDIASQKKDINTLKDELKNKFKDKDENAISAAAFLLSHQVSPQIIMQQLESIYREQSLTSKKMAADLSVEVSKTRIDVYNEQREANKKEIGAETKKASLSLGLGLGSSVLGSGLTGAGGMLSGGLGGASKFIGDMISSVGKNAEGMGTLATTNEIKAAKQERIQADMQKSMGDDFSKKTEQMEQNAQELRKKAIETIQAAANIHAQAQQSLRIKI